MTSTGNPSSRAVALSSAARSKPSHLPPYAYIDPELPTLVGRPRGRELRAQLRVPPPEPVTPDAPGRVAPALSLQQISQALQYGRVSHPPAVAQEPVEVEATELPSQDACHVKDSPGMFRMVQAIDNRLLGVGYGHPLALDHDPLGPEHLPRPQGDEDEGDVEDCPAGHGGPRRDVDCGRGRLRHPVIVERAPESDVARADQVRREHETVDGVLHRAFCASLQRRNHVQAALDPGNPALAPEALEESLDVYSVRLQVCRGEDGLPPEGQVGEDLALLLREAHPMFIFGRGHLLGTL